MQLAVLSCFRNSASGQAQHFLTQVAMLRDRLASAGWRVRVVAVWGDCVDNTPQVLMREAERHGLLLELVERSHGGPVYGSTEEPARLRALSFVGNGAFEAVRTYDNYVFYVESDLIWDANTIARLLARLESTYEFDVVAPLVFAGKAFYDIWGFRKDGERFGPFFPFHPKLDHAKQGDQTELTKVDSVGSCLVMAGDVARKCRIVDDECLVGFCRDALSKGFRIAVDAGEQVMHP